MILFTEFKIQTIKLIYEINNYFSISILLNYLKKLIILKSSKNILIILFVYR